MYISAEQLRIEELRQRYLQLINRPDVFPTRANWQFITKTAMHGLADALYRKYLIALTTDDSDRHELHDAAVEEFPQYLASIDRSEAIAAVYSDLTTAPSESNELIRKLQLFDAREISILLDKGKISQAVDIIDVYQPEYSDKDLEQMKSLAMRLSHLPTHGRIETIKGVFSSNQKYICPNGHRNSPDTVYCTNSSCGLDTHGLTESQNEKIQTYNNRVKALESLFHL